MNMRKHKRRVLRLMTTAPWEYYTGDVSGDRMWHVRHIKPCRGYSPYCDNCTAVKFQQVFGRFPYGYREYQHFRDAEQEAFV